MLPAGSYTLRMNGSLCVQLGPSQEIRSSIDGRIVTDMSKLGRRLREDDKILSMSTPCAIQCAQQLGAIPRLPLVNISHCLLLYLGTPDRSENPLHGHPI